MPIYPGADTSKMLGGFTTKMKSYRGVVLHVAVSESRFPSYAAGNGAHFYVRKDGSVAQQIDTSYKGGHAYTGNATLLGIETQGGINDAQHEPWTEAQAEAIAALLSWLAATHGIPLTVMRDSKPSSTGVGTHRLGCSGNFDAAHPGIVAGGEKWSTASGKICPGNAKIDQVPGVVARAVALSGGAAPAPAPAPAAPVAPGSTVIAPGVPAPVYPLPKGHVFGPKSGPKWQHSGYFDHREDLRRWQQRMNDRGWHITADGLYGDETAGVAEAFQREKGLDVDRLIGPQTWGAAWTAPVTR